MSTDLQDRVALRELNERLAAANKFDLDALMLNRQGILAPAQIKLMYTRLKWLGFLFLALIGIGIYQYTKNGFADKTALLIVYLFLTGYIGYNFITALKNTSAKRVESVEGIGFSEYETETDLDRDDKETTYYYRIGATRFLVKSEEAYDALINNLKYRAYFLPQSKTLINIEALQAPKSQSEQERNAQ